MSTSTTGETKPRLRAVGAGYAARRRLYGVVLDEAEWTRAAVRLEDAGLIVINGDENRPCDDVDLRVHMVALAHADGLILPTEWWTSTRAHQLVQIAAWARISMCSYDGVEVTL